MKKHEEYRFLKESRIHLKIPGFFQKPWDLDAEVSHYGRNACFVKIPGFSENPGIW